MNKTIERYYAMEQTDRQADVFIFGDITSWPWIESDVSSYLLSKKISELDVDTINIHINSYGGEVAEGWAIYNALKGHKAKIHTFAEGFACSISAVIFMSGDVRTMRDVSALMIHNPWTSAIGNAGELRKQADDLDKMAELSAKAFMERVTISSEELADLLDAETWITPEEALQKGFATEIAEGSAGEKPTQAIRRSVLQKLKGEDTSNKIGISALTVDMGDLGDQIAKKLWQQLKNEIEEPPKSEIGILDFMKIILER